MSKRKSAAFLYREQDGKMLPIAANRAARRKMRKLKMGNLTVQHEPKSGPWKKLDET